MRRGWSGFGSIESMGTERAASVGCAGSIGAGGGAWVRAERSAFSPLPSTLRGFSVLFMVENLFCELDIALRAFRAWIIGENRLTETGRLGQANTAGDYGFEDLLSEKLFKVGCNLPRQVC